MYYNIDFLRYIFTIAILIGHAYFPLGQPVAASKYIANFELVVDFFFVLAAFFLYKETQKKGGIKK